MRISQNTIDEIFNRVRIQDIVGDFVNLKKSGTSYKGLCPFHHEKTPSFMVSPAKNICKCFGCSKGGNAVNFLMELEHFSYIEALKYIADKYNIIIEEDEVTEDAKKEYAEREALLVLNDFAVEYFANNLKNTEEGQNIGLSYFRERGFNDYVIEKFKLGYSMQKRTDFTDIALKSGYKFEYLTKTGLSVGEITKYYDRFFGRVMFPIFSVAGKIIGFGGRILQIDPEKKVGKYLNSPESDIYNKSEVLYGLYQARTSINKFDECLLVEGYTDVISLFMSGIENVVASSGTSLTEKQCYAIHKITENITILYDGDSAGIKAAQRGINLLLEEGLNVKVLLFPDNDDPDSFVKKHGSEKTIEYIQNNKQDFIEFKTKSLYESSKNDPIKKAGFISNICETLACINDDLKRTLYIKQTAKNFDLEESLIYAETTKFIKNKVSKIATENFIKKQQETQTTTTSYNTPPLPYFVENQFFEKCEKEILRILLTYYDIEITVENEKKMTVGMYIIMNLQNDNLELKNLIYQKIFNLAESLIINEKELKQEIFTQNKDPEISKIAADIFFPSRDTESKIYIKNGSKPYNEVENLKEIIKSIMLEYKYNIILDTEKNLKGKELHENALKVIKVRNTIAKMQGKVLY